MEQDKINIDSNTPDMDKDVYVTEDNNGYYLSQTENPNKKNLYTYNVYNPADIKVATWKSREDALSMTLDEFENSLVGKLFYREAEYAERTHSTTVHDLADKGKNDIIKDTFQRKVSNYSYQPSLWDLDDDFTFYYTPSSYKWTPPPKSTGFLDKLNKSDTLVIHCEDRSTDMLSQIYEGKHWDVLRDGNIDKDELHQLMNLHKNIVCLGHGTAFGLINKQGGGQVVGDSEAPFLKDKNLFIIWCNADKYFERHGIGRGYFITGNMPSERWESISAGCGNITEKLMLENITYWSKLCAEICESCLRGNTTSAVESLKKKYLEKYGNHPVTVYNALRSKLLGQQETIPKYEFKGEALKNEDFPIPDFNEEKFLEHPVQYAKECPSTQVSNVR